MATQSFKFKEIGFNWQASGVSGKCAIGANHAVAGNENDDRIVCDCRSHSLRACCDALRVQQFGELSVRCGSSVRDLTKTIPHCEAEEGAHRRKWGHGVRVVSSKVLIQPDTCSE